jgi:hypothetical protein
VISGDIFWLTELKGTFCLSTGNDPQLFFLQGHCPLVKFLHGLTSGINLSIMHVAAATKRLICLVGGDFDSNPSRRTRDTDKFSMTFNHSSLIPGKKRQPFLSLSVDILCLSIYLSVTLQPFVGPWPLFQFIDLLHSVGLLGREISRRKASPYTHNNTITE